MSDWLVIPSIRISDREFPVLVRAMNEIHANSHGPLYMCKSAPSVAIYWVPFLGSIEKALSGLSLEKAAPEDDDTQARIKAGEPFTELESEFFTFCIGEATAARAIAGRSQELTLANVMLNDFFEGWSIFGLTMLEAGETALSAPHVRPQAETGAEKS